MVLWLLGFRHWCPFSSFFKYSWKFKGSFLLSYLKLKELNRVLNVHHSVSPYRANDNQLPVTGKEQRTTETHTDSCAGVQDIFISDLDNKTQEKLYRGYTK